MDVHAFFDALWADFSTMAPAAASIRALLVDAGETVLNDHVAFRTFDRGPIALDKLERPLFDLGYRRLAPYAFPDRHLRAFGYVHPEAGVPKVFLSELLTGEMSAALQATVDGLIDQIPDDLAATPEVFFTGRPWAPVPHATYEALLAESEYAGWLVAMGLRANHFTVALHELSPPWQQVEDMLQFVERHGFGVNGVGGRVKGSPAVLLEQGATLADRMPLPFADGLFEVPTGFYEFAHRHPMADGTRYPGFVAANADRIFSSTDVRAA